MNAIVSVAPYVLSELMRDLVGHDRAPSAYLLYLHLLGRAGPSGTGNQVSLTVLAEDTGLSRRAVQRASFHLQKRGLLTVIKTGPTEISRYIVRQPWAEQG
jgi:hypothetical protein